MGMVGEDLSIRSINVEFGKLDAKNTFADHLKVAVTAHMNKRLKNWIVKDKILCLIDSEKC